MHSTPQEHKLGVGKVLSRLSRAEELINYRLIAILLDLLTCTMVWILRLAVAIYQDYPEGAIPK